MEKLIALAGIAIILGGCVLFSTNRRAINWRLVGAGMLLQVVLAVLILRVSAVRDLFDAMGAGVQGLLDCAKTGLAFVFGAELVQGRFIFALVIGASIIVVGAITSVLYHWGVLQWIVRVLAFALRKTMRVSGVEALSTSAEVFLGQVESQLLVSRYIKLVTQSELLGIMSAAMATISGSALVAYVGLGINPTYLMMASFMTAPAALVISKILVPETDDQALDRPAQIEDKRETVNFIDAASEGGWQGARVAANVMVQLIVFISLVELANTVLSQVLMPFGLDWRIQDIFGIAFVPVAWLIGIPWEEALAVGPLLGTKTILNEFIAYVELAKLTMLSERTVMITTVALCGFANIGSIGINIGGLKQMAPERKADIARMGWKALVSATLAGWLAAAVAGLLI